MSCQLFDLAVVGGGIIGLAHAWAAVRSGKRVALIERDVRANGASIRNFGFITVTGQERGDSWSLARRTRDVWAELAPAAGIPVEQRGLMLTARSAEALAVIEAFLKTEMGDGCHLMTPDAFCKAAHGLGGLVVIYVGLTALRDFRVNFAVEIWTRLGFSSWVEFLVVMSYCAASVGLVLVAGSGFYFHRRLRHPEGA